jgi:hypothetical protein
MEGILAHLWHQWTFLGVAGSSSKESRPSPSRLIDPEALVLATTFFGRHDARLFDEALDCLIHNGERINLQRLQNLEATWHLADLRVFGGVAEVLAGHRSTLSKWRKLGTALSPSLQNQVPAPFFLDAAGSPLPPPPDNLDPRFLRWNLARSRWTPREMSQSPSPSHPENLLFKLRSLFGTNSRAEIIAWLLLNGPASPAALARELGYFSKTVQGVLNEMALSGHVVVHRTGREKRFQLRGDEWEFLFVDRASGAVRYPVWEPWAGIYAVVKAAHQFALNPEYRSASQSSRSIELRRALDALPDTVPTALLPEVASSRPVWDRLASELCAALK